MSKKITKKDKELRKLRRENEFLKAQLSSKVVSGKVSSTSTVVTPVKKKKYAKNKTYFSRVTPQQLRKDLTKAGIISGVCFVVIGMVYFII